MPSYMADKAPVPVARKAFRPPPRVRFMITKGLSPYSVFLFVIMGCLPGRVPARSKKAGSEIGTGR